MREIVREDGVLALGFRGLGDTVYRRLLLLDTNLSISTDHLDDRCRWLRASEAAAHRPDIPEREIARRLTRGQRCVVLELPDAQIAHSVWCMTDVARIDYLEMWWSLAPGEVYLFWSYTSPAQRGRGFARTATRCLQHALREEGCVRTVVGILPDRRSAYSSALGAGLKPCGYLGWWRLGPWRWTFHTATNPPCMLRVPPGADS